MATQNNYSTFSADVVAYIAEKTIPLLFRTLVVYQFGEKYRLPEKRGKSFTATRYNRVALPFAPLSEGVPPIGESMSISQVSVTTQQWGDTITITDIAEMTIYHPVFQKAMELIRLQMMETLERNTFNALLAGTQIDYVGTVGSRAALTNGSVITPYEITRMYNNLFLLGALQYDGTSPDDPDPKKDADAKSTASKDPATMPHYVAIMHPLVRGDFIQNSTVVTAWSYSDVNRLYNAEAGEWGGVRFCISNMVPTWTGKGAGPVATPSNTGGNLAAGTYYVQVTGSDTNYNYESQIYTVAASVTTTGTTGSITITTPNVTGYVYNVYVGTTSTPNNLGLSPQGPTAGSQAGQAIQLPGNTSITITGLGNAQSPPASPATGVTVYPTFILGKTAYGQVTLADPEFNYLQTPDKSDPLNQLRVVGWKLMYGTLIQNNQMMGRIESSSAFSGTFG